VKKLEAWRKKRAPGMAEAMRQMMAQMQQAAPKTSGDWPLLSRGNCSTIRSPRKRLSGAVARSYWFGRDAGNWPSKHWILARI